MPDLTFQNLSHIIIIESELLKTNRLIPKHADKYLTLKVLCRKEMGNMGFNFIGPFMLAMLTASVISLSAGLINKNKKLSVISFIILLAIIIAYIILFFVFE